MEEKLDVEYCRNCEDIYATNATIWLLFGNYEGETTRSGDDVSMCPRCYLPIRRYHGYLDALNLRETSGFIDSKLEGINDLSDSSKDTLRVVLENFSVPSFAVVFKGDTRKLVEELERKRYVISESTNDHTVVTLNAHKLELLDNEPLLLKMVHQRSFIINPEYIRDKNVGGKRRLARLEILPHDFTEEDKDTLLRKFDGKCALTGKDVPIHFDHVIPVAIGHGGTVKGNMLPIWQRINSSKSDRNIFEWYEENGDRFDVCPKRFEAAIEYLAELNGMSVEEYRDYVNDCHANPNDVLTKETV